MRSVDPGRFDKSVSLEDPSRTKDGRGGYTDSWAAISPSPVFASIEPATAGAMERLAGAGPQSSATHIVQLHYHSGISTKTRVVYGSRYLYVRGVQNVDEDNVLSRLFCEERIS